MIINGKNFFKNNNKNFKVIICNNDDIIKEMVYYFEKFNNIDEKRYVGIDFEFNRSLDKTKREIALFQINLETVNDDGIIYMFYPPNLTNDQLVILKNLLLNKDITKIIHGGESLDIPYLFNNLFKSKKEQREFCKNIFDTKYLCEYYNLENNLSENKCKIYYLLKQMDVVTDKQFEYLLKNEEDMGPIYNIRINVKKMSQALINYCAYDVLYLSNLLEKFPQNETYQNLIPEITSTHFILKQTKFFKKNFKKVSEFNNIFTEDKQKLIEYYNKINIIIKRENEYIYEITYFKKFFEIVIKYLTYYIIINKLDTYEKSSVKNKKKLKPPNKIIKKFITFKYLVKFVENYIFKINNFLNK